MVPRVRHLRAGSCLALFAWLAIAASGYAADAGSQPPSAPPAEKIAPDQLDQMLGVSSVPNTPAADGQFLRRASFDLLGRPPKAAEQQEFAADASPEKYHNLIERLLASNEFGDNWANYWCDTIAFRTPPPELTYLNYGPFKAWLAERLNAGVPWGEIVQAMITAQGKLQDHPPATWIGYHQASPTNLAAETSRIFLAQQISCAECHDHPFDHWKRAEFHGLAAFFARTKSKLSQNDGLGTVVSSADKGEYQMPDMHDPSKPGTELQPTLLSGSIASAKKDSARRRELAQWVTAPNNPWFAKAYTNRIWSRLMGRGFYEPIDDMGSAQQPVQPAVHEALAGHFVASGYDVKDLFRVLMHSTAYRQGGRMTAPGTIASPPEGIPLRFRGDEVFAALAVGIGLPNLTPAAVKPTDAIRFPPPPKSTRDLVHEAFGSDPSLAAPDAPRTMAQALFMMNNGQLHAQLSAATDSGTMLERLLAKQPDDAIVCRELFQHVLSRDATPAETKIALEHVKSVGTRGTAFEDLLWSLINSAEFTTRK